MIQFLFWIFQEAEKSQAYEAGKKVGYFLGSNFFIIMPILMLAIALMLFYTIRKRRKAFDNE